MYKTFLESTVAADIAQATAPSKIQKREKCKECNETPCVCDEITESPVGSVGRTGKADAENHLSNPQIRKQLKKLIRQAGGKTVILQMLKTFNEMPVTEDDDNE